MHVHVAAVGNCIAWHLQAVRCRLPRGSRPGSDPRAQNLPTPAHDAHQGLSCSLDIIKLDEKPKFIALSYVWGDSTKTKTVHVDGVAVEATENLHDALLWYRHYRPRTPIWADAICINQADLVEKSHQIGQMSRVYQEAYRVVCWLGPSTPQMDKYSVWGLRLSLNLGDSSAVRVLRSAAWRAAFVARSCFRGQSRLGGVLESLQMATGQNEFSQLSYFQRVWTFQESLLPRRRARFVLGGALIKYTPRRVKMFCLRPKDVHTARELLCESADGLQSLKARILDELSHPAFSILPLTDIQVQAATHVVAEEKAEEPNLLYILLSATADRACHDQRDNIFALLGMLRRQSTLAMEAIQKYLAIDYSKPITAVVRDALYFVYHYEKKIAFFDICAAQELQRVSRFGKVPSVQPGDCPSWLPDLSARRPQNEFGLESAWEVTKSLSEWTSRSSPDGQAIDILRITAHRVARVLLFRRFPETTRDILDDFWDVMSGAKQVEAWGLQQRNGSPEPDQDVLSSAERIPLAAPSAAAYSWAKFFTRLTCHENLSRRLGHALMGKNKKTLQDYQLLPQKTFGEVESNAPLLNQHEQSMLRKLCGQTLAILDNGRFTVCDAAVQVGDVAFAAGCYEDFIILRPFEGGDAQAGDAGAGDVCAAVAGQEGDRRTDTPFAPQGFYHMVGWAMIEGLGVEVNFDIDYAKKVFATEPEKVCVV
ncbi:HET domain-containing protein [Microdochium nivale]|nr:HET domain-containing protein [Microdochium nivale]